MSLNTDREKYWRGVETWRRDFEVFLRDNGKAIEVFGQRLEIMRQLLAVTPGVDPAVCLCAIAKLSSPFDGLGLDGTKEWFLANQVFQLSKQDREGDPVMDKDSLLLIEDILVIEKLRKFHEAGQDVSSKLEQLNTYAGRRYGWYLLNQLKTSREWLEIADVPPRKWANGYMLIVAFPGTRIRFDDFEIGTTVAHNGVVEFAPEVGQSNGRLVNIVDYAEIEAREVDDSDPLLMGDCPDMVVGYWFRRLEENEKIRVKRVNVLRQKFPVLEIHNASKLNDGTYIGEDDIGHLWISYVIKSGQ